jgi:hypothetical protein
LLESREDSRDEPLVRTAVLETVDLSKRPPRGFSWGEFGVDEGGEIACLARVSVDPVRRSDSKASSGSGLDGCGGGV